MTQTEIFKQIEALSKTASAYADCARKAQTESFDAWSIAYDLIFSSRISKRVQTLVKELGMSLEYYDPDTSYEEDVVAFVTALEEFVEQLAVFQ